jgi:hypothetical protein
MRPATLLRGLAMGCPSSRLFRSPGAAYDRSHCTAKWGQTQLAWPVAAFAPDPPSPVNQLRSVVVNAAGDSSTQTVYNAYAVG